MKFRYRLFSSHLDDDEKILYVAHRHILVFKFAVFKVFMFGLVLPIGGYLLFPKLLLIWGAWAIVGFFAVFYHFIDWYFDAWLLTNKGVIDIERNGLFDRNATRVDYHMIEGMSYTISRVIPTLFNYGDITLDKLGTQTTLVLKDAASPKKLESKVLGYQERYVNDRSFRDHNALKDMLSEMIAYHIQNDKLKSKKP